MPSSSSSSYLLLPSLELSDTKVYEPQIRALLGTIVGLLGIIGIQAKTRLVVQGRLDGRVDLVSVEILQ